jgi:phosphoglycolate phosphatase
MYENSVYPMIPELLEELCHSGRKLVVATSKPTVFAAEILRHFALDRYFKLIVGSNLDGSRVNKYEVISFALKELKIEDLNQVVMVGDSEHDVAGAKKAGIASIGVLYGYGLMEEIVEANPTYIADSVNDLRMVFGV